MSRCAQELGDDDGRDVHGEVLDEVDPTPVLDLVDDLIRQIPDMGCQDLDLSGREPPAHQAPEPGVFGVVGDAR